MDGLLHVTGQGANYAMAMLTLQEEAGLTYKEARVILARFRGEYHWGLAQQFGVSDKAVMNMARRARNKMAEAGLSIEDVISEYPMDPIMFDPPPVGEETN